MPTEPRAHLLSTYKRNVDENTGIQLGLRGNGNRGITLAITITTASAQLDISDRGVVHPDVWYHIAFAWHNTTHFALYIDFVNRATSHFVDEFEEGYVPQPIPEAHIASGFQNPPNGEYTGFGLLDELAVFSEVISASQIMQLQNSD